MSGSDRDEGLKSFADLKRKLGGGDEDAAEPEAPADQGWTLESDEGVAGAEDLDALPDTTVRDRVTRRPDGFGPMATGSPCYADVDSEEMELLASFRVRTVFPDDVRAEVRNLPEDPDPADFAGRVDRRGETIFTIDGDDAKDYDDAIGIRALEDGAVELGVHIADVAHYVRPDTALDAEALARGTSIYLPDQVVPMLPEELSNHLCSLVPQRDRLAYSVLMTFDAQGRRTAARVEKSVIRSRHRNTYRGVQQLLDGEDTDEARAIAHLEEPLRLFERWTRKQQAIRDAKGSLRIPSRERKMRFDADGQLVAIVDGDRFFSNALIEETALAANQAVGDLFRERGLPTIYRVHPEKDPEEIEALGRTLADHGIRLPKKERLTGRDIGRMIRAARRRPNAEALIQRIMGLVERAVYEVHDHSEDVAKHFGLAREAYLHFTSPIRRYPDLIVHRWLWALESRQDEAESELRADALVADLNDMASHSSTQSELAEMVSTAVWDLKVCQFMHPHICARTARLAAGDRGRADRLQRDRLPAGARDWREGRGQGPDDHDSCRAAQLLVHRGAPDRRALEGRRLPQADAVPRARLNRPPKRARRAPAMTRKLYFTFSIVAIVGIALCAQLWPPAWWGYAFTLPLVALGLHDITQRKHGILRNFPVIGHGRYLFEAIRPEISQYFIESNTNGRPFNREQRSVVYQRAKRELDTLPFGTQSDLYEVGYEWIEHSLAAGLPEETDPRVEIGATTCERPYSASLLNVSAMSFGSLSKNAILALNQGARLGGFAHNTGEGGVSPYHLEHGGDLIWQIGTGYFGCRTPAGAFDPERFARNAERPSVKMIEIKLSQGAKPGHGGILPAKKVTPEIAEIRGVPLGRDVLSPPAHTAFTTPLELCEFLAELRELSGGKPIGLKLCIGRRAEFLSIVKAMLQTGITPDFIQVDGGEGGTGAAPLEFSNSVGSPLREGLAFVHSALVGAGLRERLKIAASGKIVTGFDLARSLALGADFGLSARAMMMALGCIQARRCNDNTCPVGVATQNPWLVVGLVVSDKARRVANFHHETVESLVELLGAAGLRSPDDLTPAHLMRRVRPLEVLSYDQIHDFLEPGELLEEKPPPGWSEIWGQADEASFQPRTPIAPAAKRTVHEVS